MTETARPTYTPQPQATQTARVIRREVVVTQIVVVTVIVPGETIVQYLPAPTDLPIVPLPTALPTFPPTIPPEITIEPTPESIVTAIPTELPTATPEPLAVEFMVTGVEGDPLAVQFQPVVLVGAPVSYLWNFGDLPLQQPLEATEAAPIHIYAAAGQYRVTLTVWDANQAVSLFEQDIILGAAP